jgi:Acyl-protein synthetase, LuxE
MFRYRCSFVGRLVEDIGCLICGEKTDWHSIWTRLCELAIANSPVVADYWKMTERGRGIPDGAFKATQPYFFPDQPPARTFRTSGTTGGDRGSASYSPHGMDLMRLSILENARQHAVAGLERPAMIRFVPAECAAPEMVMAYGMELIVTSFGDPRLSEVVVGHDGIDYGRLVTALERVVAADLPAVLLGSSFAFVNTCTALIGMGRTFTLPRGSRVIDAGGFKGRSQAMEVDKLRAALRRCFGIAEDGFVNLFGMTELASQLYDTVDLPVGPLGERPKGGPAFVQPRVRDVETMALRTEGLGLLEVIDLCLVDHPPVLLTGDLAIANGHGPAIIGRAERGGSRGCSLAFEASGAARVFDG